VRTSSARLPAIRRYLAEGRIWKGRPCSQTRSPWLSSGHPLSSAHFPQLEFAPQLIADGFKTAQEFLQSVYRTDPSALYSTVCANYLLPAGASLVHPHMQMLITPVAYSYHGRMLDAARRYNDKNGSSFYSDLVAAEERTNERYIVRQNSWHWLAAFSPMGSNEITAVHEKEADFGLLSDDDLNDLSRGISRVLLLFERLGHLSFNFTLYSIRQSEQDGGQRCVFKIISRQNLYPNYRNDDYFLQKMLQSELIFNLPEELAERLRKIF
jgi:galactose-1-phosphate uridylyltransferase